MELFSDIKNSYIDVFNPGGVKTGSENVPSATEVFGDIPAPGSQMNYFVPAPVVDAGVSVDFLTSAPKVTEDINQVSCKIMLSY